MCLKFSMNPQIICELNKVQNFSTSPPSCQNDTKMNLIESAFWLVTRMRRKYETAPSVALSNALSQTLSSSQERPVFNQVRCYLFRRESLLTPPLIKLWRISPETEYPASVEIHTRHFILSILLRVFTSSTQ